MDMPVWSQSWSLASLNINIVSTFIDLVDVLTSIFSIPPYVKHVFVPVLLMLSWYYSIPIFLLCLNFLPCPVGIVCLNVSGNIPGRQLCCTEYLLEYKRLLKHPWYNTKIFFCPGLITYRLNVIVFFGHGLVHLVDYTTLKLEAIALKSNSFCLLPNLNRIFLFCVCLIQSLWCLKAETF